MLHHWPIKLVTKTLPGTSSVLQALIADHCVPGALFTFLENMVMSCNSNEYQQNQMCCGQQNLVAVSFCIEGCSGDMWKSSLASPHRAGRHKSRSSNCFCIFVQWQSIGSEGEHTLKEKWNSWLWLAPLSILSTVKLLNLSSPNFQGSITLHVYMTLKSFILVIFTYWDLLMKIFIYPMNSWNSKTEGTKKCGVLPYSLLARQMWVRPDVSNSYQTRCVRH